MSFIAGPYTGTYNGLALGQFEDGAELEFVHYDEEVRGDNFAQAVQELITRGVDAFLNATLLEYNAAALAAASSLMWPTHATFGRIGQVGRVSTSAIGGATIAKTAVLTNLPGTTATANPTTLTLALCRLPPGFPIRLLFAPRLRRVPIRLQALPDINGVLFAAV